MTACWRWSTSSTAGSERHINAVAISRADDARTELLRIVAEEQDFASDGVFDEAVGYATTLDAAEAWLTGRPRMAAAVPASLTEYR